MQSILNAINRKQTAISKPVKASIWFTVCKILQKGIQFITVPIYTRIMSTTEYGKYSIFVSWHSIISIFATLNLWNYVLNNGMIKYKNDRNGFLSALQGLSSLTTIIGCTIYLFFTEKWTALTGLTKPYMLLMFLELFFMPSYEYWCARERFEYKYKGTVIFSLLVSILIPFFSIPLILIAEDKGYFAIIGRVVSSVTIYVIPFLLIIYKGKKVFSKEYWKFALKFNIPLIPHFLSVVVLQQSDRIMIANICGEDKAGIYSVAYSAAAVLQIINSGILASFVPYTYNSIQNKQYGNLDKMTKYILIFIAFLNLILIFAAPEIIHLLGPEEYQDAVYIIPAVAISGVFMFMFNMFANIEYYFEETKYVAAASTVSAVLNVVLNAILIPLYGYYAAGYTTLFCYMLYSLGHYIFMRLVCHKFLNGLKLYDAKFLCFFSVVVIGIALTMVILYPYWYIRYVMLLILLGLALKSRKKIFMFLNINYE